MNALKRLTLLSLLTAAFVSSTASAGFLDKVVDAGAKVAVAQKSAPADDEQTMGRNLAAMVLGAFPPYGSEALNQYVTKVGLTVAAASSRPAGPYKFQVVDARDSNGKMVVNAFSAPGGYIFVTRGLLSQLKSEAQLAGVLAHEVAHVAQKHALKAIKQQKVTGALTELGGQAVAEKTSGIGGAVATEFVNQVGGPFVNNLFEKGFSRADEYKADAAAAKYAAQAGYDPNGLISFLEVLQKREGGRNYSTITRTHPQPADRISRLQKVVKNTDNKQKLEGRWRASVAGI